jgi:hypothetical protein
MRSALYYPHTHIRSENLLKTSLLMWDQLEFIVPSVGYKPHYHNKPLFERALEIFGVPRCPSEQDKHNAHDFIEDLATAPSLPEPFFYRHTDPEPFAIYPEKFMPETWQVLLDLKLAGMPLQNDNFPLTATAGLSVMSILADCCAGTTRARITDRGLAYASITNLTVDRSAAPAVDLYERVIPLTLEVVDATSLPLEQLIRFRERENKSGGHGLRELRHQYLDCIESHVRALQNVKSRSDREELDRVFQAKMGTDFRQLCEELCGAKTNAILSKELITSVLVAAASAWAVIHGLPLEIPAAFTGIGGPLTVGGLLLTKNKYSNSRKTIMQKHPMAYLYELEHS